MITKHFKHRGLAIAFAVATLFAAQAASGAGVATGSVVQLADSWGTTGGGEFIASVVGGSGLGESFATFCLEHNETFSSYGQSLYVKAVNTAAVNGGVATADNGFAGAGTPTSTFDPVSYATAYLYTQFRNNTLSNYQYLTDTTAHQNQRIADANSLQEAIWWMEDEGNFGYSTDTKAQAWVAEAVGANWTSLGNVRALNLYTDAAYTHISQDQLYMIPEPETYAMLLAGLGLMGFVARRRAGRATM